LLSTYTEGKFPEEEKAKEEVITARLSGAASAIETLQKLKRDGKISEEEFFLELERYRDTLADMLAELETSIGPKGILRARASHLYNSISSSLPSNMRVKDTQGDVSEDQQKNASEDQEKSSDESLQ
jgi:hypothetical protein